MFHENGRESIVSNYFVVEHWFYNIRHFVQSERDTILTNLYSISFTVKIDPWFTICIFNLAAS